MKHHLTTHTSSDSLIFISRMLPPFSHTLPHKGWCKIRYNIINTYVERNKRWNAIRLHTQAPTLSFLFHRCYLHFHTLCHTRADANQWWRSYNIINIHITYKVYLQGKRGETWWGWSQGPLNRVPRDPRNDSPGKEACWGIVPRSHPHAGSRWPGPCAPPHPITTAPNQTLSGLLQWNLLSLYCILLLHPSYDRVLLIFHSVQLLLPFFWYSGLGVGGVCGYDWVKVEVLLEMQSMLLHLPFLPSQQFYLRMRNIAIN